MMFMAAPLFGLAALAAGPPEHLYNRPRERALSTLRLGGRVKIWTIYGMFALLIGSATANESAMKELAPTGNLRVALVFAPSMSVFFVVKDENGRPRGVTADLAAALGMKFNRPVEPVLFPNSGLATDAVESGAVDVAFMPVDEER